MIIIKTFFVLWILHVCLLGEAVCIDVYKESVYVHNGDTALLKCRTSIKDYTHTEWLRTTSGINDEQISVGFKLNENLADTFNITNENGFYLKLQNVSYKNVGKYTCNQDKQSTIINLNTMNNSDVSLNVIPYRDVYEGQNVTLTCVIRTHRNNFNWTINGEMQMQQKTENFTISNVTRHNNAVYGCSYENTSTQINLNILHLPYVTIENRNNTLYCNVSGGNPATYTFKTWEHHSEDGSHIQYINSSQDGVLRLVDDMSDKFIYLRNGKYVCTVENGISGNNGTYLQKRAEIVVIIEGQPMCIGPVRTRKSGIISSKIDLSIDFYSYPDEDNIEWFKDGKRLFYNNTGLQRKKKVAKTTVSKYHNVFTESMSFQTFKEDDFGCYKVRITNKHGSIYCVVEVFKQEEQSVSNLLLYIAIAGSVALLFMSASIIYPRCRRSRQLKRLEVN